MCVCVCVCAHTLILLRTMSNEVRTFSEVVTFEKDCLGLCDQTGVTVLKVSRVVLEGKWLAGSGLCVQLTLGQGMGLENALRQ